MAADNTNNLLQLSDALEKIRTLSSDIKVNEKIQDKKYLQLAEDMAGISRNANTCAGIFFDMYMSNRSKDYSKPYTEDELTEQKKEPDEPTKTDI